MQEHVRLAMRRKHAERYEDCACGRRLWGNGRAAHYRACPTYLREHGYPLAESLRSAVRSEYGVDAALATEKLLGAIQMGTSGIPEYAGTEDFRRMRWTTFRDLVWQVAERVARNG